MVIYMPTLENSNFVQTSLKFKYLENDKRYVKNKINFEKLTESRAHGEWYNVMQILLRREYFKKFIF